MFIDVESSTVRKKKNFCSIIRTILIYNNINDQQESYMSSYSVVLNGTNTPSTIGLTEALLWANNYYYCDSGE